MDTFMALVAVYHNVDDAVADYDVVHDLSTEAHVMEAYDAAVIERRDDGKVRIVKKHETPTRSGGVGGATIGLAAGLAVALFPAVAIGGGILLGTSAGAAIGALAGHAASGMSRKDLKELGEHLDEGQAGLIVVGVPDMEGRVAPALGRADRIEVRPLVADVDAIARDVTPPA